MLGRLFGDDALVGPAATILMVLVVAIAGAIVYHEASKLAPTGEPPSALMLQRESSACGDKMSVQSSSSGLPLGDLRLTISPTEGAYRFAIDGVGWADGWQGSATVGPGDIVDVWSDRPRAFWVVHVPTNAIVHKLDVFQPVADAAKPGAPTGVGPIANGVLSGAASDVGCSGVASVTLSVRELDGTLRGAVAATIASPGAPASAWSAALPAGLSDGAEYDVTVVTRDTAGNEDPTTLRLTYHA